MTNVELIDFFIGKLDILENIPETRILAARRFPILNDTLSINRWRLIIILSGKRLHRFTDGKKRIECFLNAGDILLVEPFAGLWCEEDQTYDMLSIVNTPSAIRFVSKKRNKGIQQPKNPDAVLLGGQTELKSFQLVLELLNQVMARKKKPDVQLLLKFLWQECRSAICSGIHLPQSGPQHMLENIIDFIGEHLTEKINCSRVASEFNISANYVAQLFAREMSCGFSEYVCNLRLELAKQLLINSNMNISEIADYCGFNQTNYFIKLYKNQYGCTPLKYRISLDLPGNEKPRSGQYRNGV